VKGIVGIGGIALAAGLAFAAFVGGRALEQQPSFCGSCHEERENYERWLSSGAAADHKTCIECHTGPGFTGIVHGQARGARHAVAHVLGNYVEPLRALVPSEWCLNCHPAREVEAGHQRVSAFAEGRCALCHNHKPGSRFKAGALGPQVR